MTTATSTIEELANREYQHGFVTDIEAESVPRGLNEDIVRTISAKKGEPDWLLQWRLKAYRHWLTMEEPRWWPHLRIAPIDYQDIIYYSAPKQKKKLNSLDEVDPELRRTFEKLGISLDEQKRLSGVAVDAVFDSVSVATTFKGKLAEMGVIFCSFSEAVREHPELVRKYLGSVVPANDNFFAALNSAVFSDGSFCYIPKGVRCPMELSTYFRINAAETGQFERTLIVAEEGAYVSYLEGCTAPMRDTNQLHAAVVELVAVGDRLADQVFDGAELVSRRQGGARRHLQLRDQARRLPRAAVEDLVDAGGDRLGDHLEVPELHPARRRFGRRVLLGGADEPQAAGRHRHEDDPHRPQHQEHDRVQGHLGRQRPEHLPRPGEGAEGGGERPQLLAVRLAACWATAAGRTPSRTSR